jgi:regulator of sigma E protease
VTPYPHPLNQTKEFLTTGIISPANYLIYDKLPNGNENVLLPNSSLKNSGLEYGDQIVWLDGKRIFSLTELSALLNDGRALVTVERDGKTFLARVPRVHVHDLTMTPEVQNELTDWQFAGKLNAEKFSRLFTFPYNMTNNGIIENQMTFIDPKEELETFPATPESELERSLLAGDKIVAVDGVPVTHSAEILKLIQERQINLVISRPKERAEKISWQVADAAFDKSANQADIDALAKSIGTSQPLERSGNVVLLKPAKLKSHREIYAGSEEMNLAVEAQRARINLVDDPLKKAELLQALEKGEAKYELGLPVRDLRVEYNPVPTTQFFNVVKEITKTLKSLFTGALNPKWMSGPVGIVSMFQEQTRSGIGETLFWLGTISLNLGLLNLLPIPMLDGGTIVINLIEMISGRKIKPETLEKIIFPFALLLIGFFIFLTYHDVARLFGWG